MSIRSRLTLAIIAILLLTIGALGVQFVRVTRQTLVGQIDARVLEIALRNDDARGGQGGDRRDPAASPEPSGTPRVGPAAATPAAPGRTPTTATALTGVAYRDVCRFFYDARGALVHDEACGFSDAPLSPPRVDDVSSAVALPDAGDIVTLASRDGALAYRAALTAGADGGVTVTAAPLSGVDAAIDDLIRRMLVGAALATAIAGAIGWWSIRRVLRPVEGMVETATAIAAGELSRRVEVGDPRTELGRLGAALNAMLGRIEAALAAQAASEARMREFVGDAAHELRTPLTSLRGWAELYRRGMVSGDDGVRNAMARIESEGERMAHLVDDLLLLARMDQQRPMEFAPLDLVVLAREALLDFSAADPQRPTTLLADTPAPVVGDRDRLRQVIDNLLRNVRTHTPPQTPVTIAVTPGATAVELRVTDTGPGIAPDDLPHVFERFWRSDVSRSRAMGGSGLGLAIVAAIVEAHHGTVAVESAPGEGASFIVRLPGAGSGA